MFKEKDFQFIALCVLLLSLVNQIVVCDNVVEYYLVPIKDQLLMPIFQVYRTVIAILTFILSVILISVTLINEIFEYNIGEKIFKFYGKILISLLILTMPLAFLFAITSGSTIIFREIGDFVLPDDRRSMFILIPQTTLILVLNIFGVWIACKWINIKNECEEKFFMILKNY